jgi:threonine/homoserine/homoserine lactone efflux protein
VDPVVFLKGVIIAFVMAIPIGPVGTSCLRTTLARGHAYGVLVGLGAATVDSLYGGIAAFGLSFVSDLIATQQVWVRSVGGVFLLFVGVRTFRGKSPSASPGRLNGGMVTTYAETLLLGLSNPGTTIAFLAVFAACGLGHGLSLGPACALVLGVFTGSWLWFLTLGYVATSFRSRLDARALVWVDRVAGIVIVLSGLAGFATLI